MSTAPQISQSPLDRGFWLRLLIVVGVIAVAVVGGAGQASETASASEPAATIVSANADGLASLTVAPKTWSSRSQVRWKARMGSEARYVV